MRAKRKIIALVSIGALLVSACGSSGGDDTAATTTTAPNAAALVVDGKVDLEVLDAVQTDFAGLDPAQQQERANEASGQLERELYKLSGLEAALGGPDAVDASIKETARWSAGLADQVTKGAAAAQFQPQGLRSPVPTQAGKPSLGEGLFGGLMMVMLGPDAVVSRTNDGTTGQGEIAQGMRVKATNSRAELTTDHSLTDDTGVTTQLRTKTAVTPCPGPDGTFDASASIELSSTIANGATGTRATFDVTVKGTVDDNAELVGFDTGYRGQLADFVAKRGGYLDFSATRPQKGPSAFTVNRTGGEVTQSIVSNTVILASMVAILTADRLVAAAEKGWKSGRCVVLKPTVSAGPSGLQPSTSVIVKAAPRSKMDGSPVGGKVTAVLSAGGASVSPAATKVPADATFTYRAPGSKDKTGSVALEARSRRGVAKATVDFDTKQAGYTATGKDEVTFSGKVASLTSPFEIGGTFPGGGATFHFDGASARGGALTISGGGSGATVTGGGTYTVTDNPDGTKTLTVQAHSCVNVSGACRTGTHLIKLTPSS